MTTQREGWLGEEYVRIYAENDRPRVAEIYDFAAFLPGYEPCGSWGLDALCLGPDGRLYTVDWIPLEQDFQKERYGCVAEFEADIARLHESGPSYEHFQKEIHYAHPLVLGGDPQAAPMMLDQPTHAQACCFFNKLCREMKAKSMSKPSEPV